MLLFEQKTETIIKCFYKVYNTLGYGFLEKVYENAMVIELVEEGFTCFQQQPLNVLYKNIEVGYYFPDIIVDNEIILELKAGDGEIIKEHELQLMNYLRSTDLSVGFIFHFGKRPAFKRRIFT